MDEPLSAGKRRRHRRKSPKRKTSRRRGSRRLSRSVMWIPGRNRGKRIRVSQRNYGKFHRLLLGKRSRKRSPSPYRRRSLSRRPSVRRASPARPAPLRIPSPAGFRTPSAQVRRAPNYANASSPPRGTLAPSTRAQQQARTVPIN